MKILIISILSALSLFANDVLIADNVAYVDNKKEEKQIAINICNISYLEHIKNDAIIYMKNVETPIKLKLDKENTKKIISELSQCKY